MLKKNENKFICLIFISHLNWLSMVARAVLSHRQNTIFIEKLPFLLTNNCTDNKEHARIT